MIRPVSIPSAAGLNYGENDTRHFSEGDALDVVGLQNPTRYLAQRDNILAAKVNEVISSVNNREQIVPIQLPRTTLAPGEELVPYNYRIPPGFEARVLNAVVTASPVSADIELNVLYAAGFGNATGESLISTSGEFTSGTSFKGSGELIVVLKNKGASSLDVIASILLTMRPVGDEGTLLVGSTVRGDRGLPGQKGDRGEQGIPGTGGAGSPGMVWTGEWVGPPTGRVYNQKDVASFPLYGSLIGSYICIQGHNSSDAAKAPPNSSFWDVVALGSSGSVTGVAGPPGPGGAGAVITHFNVINGTFTTGSDWDKGSYAGYDSSTMAVSTDYTAPVNEAVIKASTGTLCFLFGLRRMTFRGSGTLTLPSIALSGATVDYTNTNINAFIVSNGTQAGAFNAGFSGTSLSCVPVSTNQFVLKVIADQPQRVAVTVQGVQVT